MIDIKSYFIVSSASLGIAYCFYKLFFRSELKFSRHRRFLLGSVAMSVLLPLTHVSIDFRGKTDQTLLTEAFTLTGNISAQPIFPEKGIIRQLFDTLPYIYIIISALFILMLVIHLIRIFQLYRSSKKTRQGEILILRSEKIKSPFSFFSWVFLPETLSESEEMNSIIIHERVHARNFHSIDKIVFELLISFMWFNPFLWMMKRSLHLVHEYLADEGTLQSGVERTRYQALLINHAAEENLICLHSSFYNNLKQRMIMMTKSKNRGQSSSGMLTVFPLSVILIMTVAVLNGLFIHDASASDGNQEQKQKAKKDKNNEVFVTGYGAQKGQTDTLNYIVDGVNMKSIVNLSPDSIESVNVLKTDKTIVIRTKSFAREHASESKTTFETGPDKVLFILDGKHVSEKEIRDISPSNMNNITVLKGKESIQNYTDEDYDGVILVTTK